MKYEYRIVSVRLAQQVKHETDYCWHCHQPKPPSTAVQQAIATSFSFPGMEGGLPIQDALRLVADQGWRLVSNIPGPLETILIFEQPDPTERKS